MDTIITIMTAHDKGAQLHCESMHQEIEFGAWFSREEVDDVKGIKWCIEVLKDKIVFSPKRNEDCDVEKEQAYINLYTSCQNADFEVDAGRGRLAACFHTSSRSIELYGGSAAIIQFGRSTLYVSRNFAEFEHPEID